MRNKEVEILTGFRSLFSRYAPVVSEDSKKIKITVDGVTYSIIKATRIQKTSSRSIS